MRCGCGRAAGGCLDGVVNFPVNLSRAKGCRIEGGLVKIFATLQEGPHALMQAVALWEANLGMVLDGSGLYALTRRRCSKGTG